MCLKMHSKVVTRACILICSKSWLWAQFMCLIPYDKNKNAQNGDKVASALRNLKTWQLLISLQARTRLLKKPEANVFWPSPLIFSCSKFSCSTVQTTFMNMALNLWCQEFIAKKMLSQPREINSFDPKTLFTYIWHPSTFSWQDKQQAE